MEVATSCDAQEILDYFLKLKKDSVLCTDVQAKTLIKLYVKQAKNGQSPLRMRETDLVYHQIDFENLDHASTSFLANPSDNEIPQVSGLNWGQRKGREQNQAYIPVRSPLNQSNFFPSKGTVFTLISDDGTTLFCKRAQDEGKAIETPESNSILGRYFRERIGVPLGEPVKLADLERYGRTDIDFYKINDESYYMDFSV